MTKSVSLPAQETTSDIDGDGQVMANDVLEMLRIVVGLVVEKNRDDDSRVCLSKVKMI